MSYRNPKVLVDTQSGQHVQNMIKSVADSYSKFAATEGARAETKRKEALEAQKLREKEEKARRAKVDAEKQEMTDRLYQHNGGPLNMGLSQMRQAIDQYEQDLLTDPSSLTDDEKDARSTRIAKMRNTPDQVQNGIASLQVFADKYRDARNRNNGEWGSIYQGAGLTGENGEPVNPGAAHDILIGYPDASKGTVEGRIDPETGVFYVDIKADGKLLRTFTPNVEESMEEPQIVPDLNKQFAELDGKVAETLHLGDPTSPVYNGQPDLKVKHKDGSTHYHRRPSIDAYKKAAGPLVDTMVGSMEAGDLIALYNTKLNPDDQMLYSKSFTGEDDPRIAKIKGAMADFLANQYGNKTLTTSADFGIVKPKTDTSATSAARDRRDMVNRVDKSEKELADNPLQSDKDIIKAFTGSGFSVEKSNNGDGEIAITKNGRIVAYIPPNSTREEVLVQYGISHGLTLGEATDLANKKRRSKTPTKEFVDQFRKENGMVYNTVTEKMEIIKAWNKLQSETTN